MSANNPIPARLRPKFQAFMAARDNADLPDGAWFAVLEQSAQEFIDKHRLKWACNNSAAHQYIRMVSKEKAA